MRHYDKRIGIWFILIIITNDLIPLQQVDRFTK